MKANLISVGSSCTSGEASLVQNKASAGTPPADWIDAAAKIVPMKANAIPTEQMIRYFHIASSDKRLGMQRYQEGAQQRGRLHTDPHDAKVVRHQDQHHRRQ